MNQSNLARHGLRSRVATHRLVTTVVRLAAEIEGRQPLLTPVVLKAAYENLQASRTQTPRA